MNNKRGVKTSEFWFAAISSVVIALIGLLVGYKVLTTEQADLWISLGIAVIPIALMGISYGYGKSRQGVKESQGWRLWDEQDNKA